MIRLEKTIRLLALSLALVFFTGCEAPLLETPSQAEPEAETDINLDTAIDADGSSFDQIYTIYYNDYQKFWTLNANGETLPQNQQYRVLTDVITGEPQCQMISRVEATGEKGEYGDIITKDVSALFDMDGTMLYDWSDCVYSDGFGDYIVRQNRWMMFYEETLPDDFESALWNYKTGETVIPDVGKLQSLDNGKVLLMNEVYRPLGIVDENAQALSGFPAPDMYANVENVWNGYMIATDRPFMASPEQVYQYYLLDSDFKPLITYEHLYGDRSDLYLGFTDGAETKDEKTGLITPEGEEILLLEQGGYIQYFDNEIAVIHTGEYDSDENPERYSMVRIADGTVLIDGCEFIQHNYSNGQLPSDIFLALKEGELQTLSRDGAVLARRAVDGARHGEIYSDNRIRCSILVDDEYTDTILDRDLNIIVPQNVYYNVMQQARWNGNGMIYYPIMTGDRMEAGNSRRVDVMDLDGRVIIGGLNDVYQVGPNRLAVRKGFDMGLMDWEGNWIVKRSIFSDLLDD